MAKNSSAVIFVMGVSGSGKSTIGRMLADALHLPFFDGDDYHPVDNVTKMKAGIPLEDQDRYAWLNRLHDLAFEIIKKNGGVIACSALKESYRKILMHGIEQNVKWIFLDGDFDLIKKRMEARQSHFMPAKLLESQFDTLEIPSYATRISIDKSPESIVDHILNELEH